MLPTHNPILQAQNIVMRFGGLVAVSDFSMDLHSGEIVGLIGPNGAGKTTIFNILTGVYQPTSGSLRFAGESLLGLRPYEVNHKGLARTFQNIRLFKDLTVLENVMVARHHQAQYGLLSAVFRGPKRNQLEQQVQKQALELLDLFDLRPLAYEKAGALPYGQQRRLEIVRALATNPKVLFLDEPAAGMNHAETAALMDTISKIRTQFKVTILLIEHDMKLVMGICERIIVLDHGTVICTGEPKSVQSDRRVIEAYLGTSALTEANS